LKQKEEISEYIETLLTSPAPQKMTYRKYEAVSCCAFIRACNEGSIPVAEVVSNLRYVRQFICAEILKLLQSCLRRTCAAEKILKSIQAKYNQNPGRPLKSLKKSLTNVSPEFRIKLAEEILHFNI